MTEGGLKELQLLLSGLGGAHEFEPIEHHLVAVDRHPEARRAFLEVMKAVLRVAKAGVEAKRPPYTLESPTEPGWYWFRLRDGDEDVLVGGEEEVVRVFDRGGELFWEALGEDPDDSASVDQRGFEWSGPLKPPD